MLEMRIPGLCPSFAYWLLCNLLCSSMFSCACIYTKDHMSLIRVGKREFNQLLHFVKPY